MNNDIIKQPEKKKWYKRVPSRLVKVTAFVCSAGILLGVCTFGLHQLGLLDDQGVMLYHKQRRINELSVLLDAEKSQKKIVLAKNKSLQLQLDLLRDSLKLVSAEVRQLRKKRLAQATTTRNVQKRLKNLIKDYTALKQEIDSLKRQRLADQAQLASLTEQKVQLQQQIEGLNETQATQLIGQQETERELMERTVRRARMLRISQIVSQTKVVYQKILLRKNKEGKPLTKIGKGKNEWRFTEVSFFLENENQLALLDEKFMVKIVNSDTHEVLSYIESNPNFPDSDIDTKGLKFSFEGQLIEISYFNNQKKAGSNFQIQLYYIADDRQEYLLTEGTRQLVSGKRVVHI